LQPEAFAEEEGRRRMNFLFAVREVVVAEGKGKS